MWILLAIGAVCALRMRRFGLVLGVVALALSAAVVVLPHRISPTPGSSR
jgi:hypothetical protein